MKCPLCGSKPKYTPFSAVKLQLAYWYCPECDYKWQEGDEPESMTNGEGWE